MGPFEFMFKAAALAGNLSLGLGAVTKVRTKRTNLNLGTLGSDMDCNCNDRAAFEFRFRIGYPLDLAKAVSRADRVVEATNTISFPAFQKPILFLPWMVVYGSELVAGWATGISFLMLTGM